MKSTKKSKTIAESWWNATSEENLCRRVFSTAELVRTGNSTRRSEDLFHMNMYSGWDNGGRGVGNDVQLDGQLSRYNLAHTVVSTAESLIAQMRPMPYYITDGGSWSEQRIARDRTRVLEGQFSALGVYRIGPQIVKDSLIFGTGIAYVGIGEDGTPCVERVNPLEILVDHTEGRYGKPRTIYWLHLVDRESLIIDYPEHADELRSSSGPNASMWEDFFIDRDAQVDQVVVVEAWHLGRGDSPGRYACCTSNVVLQDDDWEYTDFPFAFFRYETRTIGFWGCGLVERCRAAQWRINELIAKVTRLQNLGSNAYVFLQKGESTKPSDITNEELQIFEYDGAPPTFHTVSATPVDLQQQIDLIVAATLQELGLTPGAVSGEPPAPYSSGRAIRATDDISSRRHIIPARAYEDFFMDLAKLIVRANDVAAQAESKYTVSWTAQRGRSQFLKRTKWADLELPETAQIAMFPVSALPTTPQGRWSAVQEWIDAGFVSRTFALQLLDFPDLDAALSLQNAAIDSIMYDIERIMDGKRILPDPYTDGMLAAQIGIMALAKARTLDAPGEVLWVLRDYIDAAKRIGGAGQEAVPEQGDAAQLAALPQS